MATYRGWGVRDTTRCEPILGSTQTDSVRLKTDTNRPKVGSAYLARRPHVVVHLRLVWSCHWLSWCNSTLHHIMWCLRLVYLVSWHVLASHVSFFFMLTSHLLLVRTCWCWKSVGVRLAATLLLLLQCLCY